jgi:thiol:disulfide interchange protein DsbG
MGVLAGLASWAVLGGSLALMQQSTLKLPATELATLDRGTTSLSAMSGKPMVVNLWATWCPPCRREMPVLADAQARRGDVTFAFVNQGEPENVIREYLRGEDMQLRNVLLDLFSSVSQEAGSRGLPTTLFFDADGRLVDTHMGELSEAHPNPETAAVRPHAVVEPEPCSIQRGELMLRVNSTLLILSSALLLGVTACSQAEEPDKSPPAAVEAVSAVITDKPAVIEAIEAQGLEVLGEFDAPSGLRGYAGMAGQRPVAVYATADGQHAVVGTLVNAQGEDAGAEALQRLVAEPMSKRTWAQLEASDWIVDGKPDAPRVVYTFSDPNCPFCNKFWQAARPWVDSGKVQIRNIMVGVIRPDSANKVATIYAAASPSEALERNERNYANGGIEPAATVPADVRSRLDTNEKLMMDLGFQGTPGILFRDEQGLVQRRSGMPPATDLPTVLGPR